VVNPGVSINGGENSKRIPKRMEKAIETKTNSKVAGKRA
jgi:hypothetical protein